jgi:hypothetical protein
MNKQWRDVRKEVPSLDKRGRYSPVLVYFSLNGNGIGHFRVAQLRVVTMPRWADDEGYYEYRGLAWDCAEYDRPLPVCEEACKWMPLPPSP